MTRLCACARYAAAGARRVARYVALVALALVVAPARGASFALPADGSSIVGRVRVIRLDDARNTLFDIARHYDLGYNEITAANPGMSLWLPGAGARIVVPTEFILPPRPWVGIVVDVPRRRLYYFPPPGSGAPARVVTFPIGIAQPGWPTPLGETRIIAKYKDPSWIVPKNILEEHRKAGEPSFPKYFPPGPDNPMGMLAMETGFPEVFIHGTNHPWGVGMRVSHGCLHLYPEDAAYLFARLKVGTPVRVIDAPVLAGERGGALYLSASPPVADYASAESLLTRAVAAVARYRSRHPAAGRVSWDRVLAVAQAQRIVPAPVSAGAPGLAARAAALHPEAYAFAPYDADANDAEVPPDPR
ncbi:MAG: L,D-transpeptidase family protein [Betaproteobacteria bacterium]|nr:L,D-transpeptidase family protein [Betaproteobacteria bacterium]